MRSYGRPEIERIVRAAARKYGIDEARFLQTAYCESRLDPNAHTNPPYYGLFQQHIDYWPKRAAWADMAGRSVFDPVANAEVAAKLVRFSRAKWRHWPRCAY